MSFPSREPSTFNFPRGDFTEIHFQNGNHLKIFLPFLQIPTKIFLVCSDVLKFSEMSHKSSFKLSPLVEMSLQNIRRTVLVVSLDLCAHVGRAPQRLGTQTCSFSTMIVDQLNSLARRSSQLVFAKGQVKFSLLTTYSI